MHAPPEHELSVCAEAVRARLGPRFAGDVDTLARTMVAPLAAWARSHHQRGSRVLGLHGSQGAGKSTACAGIAATLSAWDGLNVVCLSIDDVYLTRAERAELARTVHPLLETRGVPGTHDVALTLSTLEALSTAAPHSAVAVPRFNKDTDNRFPAPEMVTGPIDLVLLEGWCVGLPPIPDEALSPPCNALERIHDANGAWRAFVAQQLRGPYAKLWAHLDGLAAILAPSVDTVIRWRTQAEAARLQAGAPHAIADIATFVQHYERWTRWGLRAVPDVADLCVWVDEQRTPVRWSALG